MDALTLHQLGLALASLLLLGCAVLWYRAAAGLREQLTRAAVLEERLAGRESDLLRLQGRVAELDARLAAELSHANELQDRLSRQETLMQQEALRYEDRIRLLREAREQMTSEFRALASEIIEQKGQVI